MSRFLVTDLPLAHPGSLPAYCKLDQLPEHISVRLGEVPGFAVRQLALYNSKRKVHVIFDISRLTEDGWDVALRHAS